MKPHTISVFLIGLLGFIFMLYSGCTVLEDPERADPVGSSGGGIPFPIGPRSNIGTFSLKVEVGPSSLPADGISAAQVIADLDDASGRPVSGFLIVFESEIGAFSISAPSLPVGSLTSTTATGRAITDAEGKASIFLVSTQAGSSPITAVADVNQDGTADPQGEPAATTFITFTEAPGVPGPGVGGLVLTADPVFQTIEFDPLTAPEPVTILADVFDAFGQRAGPGVRVEFSTSAGAITPFADTDANGQATATLTLPPLSRDLTVTVTGRVVINGQIFTDSVSVFVDIIEATPVPTPVPGQVVEIELSTPTASVPGTVTLTATVTDRAGNPAPNVDVVFRESHNCAPLIISPTLPTTRTTNSSGVATANLNILAGTSTDCFVNFTATIPTGANATQTLTLTAPTPTPAPSPTPTP